MPEPLAGDGEQGVRDGRRNRAEAEFAYSGDYPLARFLYLSVNYKPGSRLDDLRGEFVRFIFSREGQEVVVKDGYLPVPATVAREELKSVGIEPGF